jgi:hypothetical protein
MPRMAGRWRQVLAGLAVSVVAGGAGAQAGPTGIGWQADAVFVPNVGQLDSGVRFQVWGPSGASA